MHKITENEGNLITVRVSGKFTQAAAPSDDLPCAATHARKVEPVALVGEKIWQEWLTKIGSISVMRDQAKYFETSALAEAERWVRAG